MIIRNRLWGNKVYLAGVIDRVSNKEAITWRKELTPFLNSLGIIVLDPCDKKMYPGYEIEDEQSTFIRLKKEEKYQEFRDFGKPIRLIDLRMVDKADFIIAKIDMDVFNCGTIEEITTANRSKKPILIWCPQGIKELAGWFKLMMPLQTMFDNLTHLKKYIISIDQDQHIDDLGRWRFFDYRQLYQQILSPDLINLKL